MPITINDIAEKAQVSRATVSLVLRDEDAGRVGTETAARVRRVMRELDYRPNAAARRMRAKQPHLMRTNTLGCLFHVNLGGANHSAQYFYEVLAGCNAEASRLNQHVLMGYGHAETSVLQAHMLELLDDKVDGWLIGAFAKPSLLKFFKRHQVPAVWVGSSMDMTGVLSQVRGDDFQGSYQAIRHLTELGHRRIACIMRSPESGWNENMLVGGRKALQEAGIADFSAPVHHHYDDEETMRQIAAKLFLPAKKKSHPTAIFVRGDREAMWMIQALLRKGLKVPDDVSVIGHDNLPVGEMAQPPLTTIRVPRREIGESAVRQLLEIIEGRRSTPVATILPLQLIVRQSTAPAKTR